MDMVMVIGYRKLFVMVSVILSLVIMKENLLIWERFILVWIEFLGELLVISVFVVVNKGFRISNMFVVRRIGN